MTFSRRPFVGARSRHAFHHFAAGFSAHRRFDAAGGFRSRAIGRLLRNDEFAGGG